ncbi:unnamed protein product [Clonostachys solani]|uniref:SPIN90/Ldb17 leucine-rich domain-containing protein n=1 Tax=Clonostachys solani TaxID=160281 RepID=A0A9N9Z767_9HYPO|nr:unnamed protein product [Clonostachys solani]
MTFAKEDNGPDAGDVISIGLAPIPPLANVATPQCSPADTYLRYQDLTACVETECDGHEAIDDALRTWLELTLKLRELLNCSQEHIVTCSHLLLRSPLFRNNKDYVRQQIIHSLLQEDDAGPLHAISCFLLLDGHHEEALFPRMIDEACFPKLLELLNAHKDDDPMLHRFLLQLMYEMSRMERLRRDDILLVNDDFIHYLFGIIQNLSDDVHDPYHYPTIRVLLVLNEQYMLASTDVAADTPPLTNRIVKCLSLHGPDYRTFGENIILLLNRETETSLQLLILKLLYLLFTTKATYEYFYTNDLKVLLDVIIRNLMDLPDEKMALRHTYLRVLYPLLAHTQLSQPPHYKRDEVLGLLHILRGSHNAHFAPADETTLRLVDRVSKVSWLDTEQGKGEAEVARKILGISLSPSQTDSSISVSNVAEVMEKPGVQTPSRNKPASEAVEKGVSRLPLNPEVPVLPEAKKRLPTVPKHRHGVPFVSTTNGTPKKIPPKAPPPRRLGRTRTAQLVSPTEPVKSPE